MIYIYYLCGATKHVSKMKKIMILTALALMTTVASAQKEAQPFKGYFTNEELEVYIRLNLYEDMDIPEHELLGPLPGYLAKQRNGFYWLINSAEVKGNKANVEFVNDYGSEDLSATLRMPNDSTLVLEQGRGSSIKVPKNGKWFKLPSKITFKRK